VQWHPEFHDPANADLLHGGPLLQEFLERAEAARDRVARKPATEPAASG
jgi:hypothetical protein